MDKRNSSYEGALIRSGVWNVMSEGPLVSEEKSALTVEIERMPQLYEAKDAEDDWTGLADARARRQRQNRLNVRAYRRRKALEARAHARSNEAEVKDTTQSTSETLCWIESQQTVASLPTSSLPTNLQNCKSHSLLTYHDPNTHQPTHTIILPLSVDHLLTLVQFNTLRACVTNLTILGLMSFIPAECSMANDIQPAESAYLSCSTSMRSIPPTFAPTVLQKTTPHEVWIDAIPHPRWRDNLIRAKGTYDEDDLCVDCVGGLWEGFPEDTIVKRGVMAWNDPWDVWGWEVSEGFFEKWGWSLKGCWDVLEASNRWRTVRGEEPLVVEL